MNPSKCATIFLLLAVCASGVFASENLLFNSSFELGESGWSAFRMNRKPVPDKFLDLASSWEIDTDDAYLGNNCFRYMKQDEKDFRSTVLCSHDFWVDADKTYIVSFWAKSSRKGTRFNHQAFSSQRMVRRDASGNPLPDVEFGNCGKDAVSDRGKGTVTLSKDWQRYSFSFTPEKGFTVYAIWLETSAKSVSVLLDCVQVEEGELTDYAPKSKVEAAVTTDDYLYEDCESVGGVVKAVSYAGDQALSLPVTLFDTYLEKKLQEKALNFELKKDEVLEKSFEFSSIPYGMFCAYTGLQPRTTPAGFHAKWDEQPECLNYERLKKGDESYQSAAYFVSVRKEQKFKKTGFRLGTSGPLDNYLNIGGSTCIGNCNEMTRIFRLAGGNVIRCLGPEFCRWNLVEPEKGKFVWDGFDKRLEVARKAGIELMCVIGSMFMNRPKTWGPDMVPEWAQKRDRSGNPEGELISRHTWLGRNGDKRYYQPQIEDWREYVSAVANHYKGK